jgi:hypothetical protein
VVLEGLVDGAHAAGGDDPVVLEGLVDGAHAAGGDDPADAVVAHGLQGRGGGGEDGRVGGPVGSLVPVALAQKRDELPRVAVPRAVARAV